MKKMLIILLTIFLSCQTLSDKDPIMKYNLEKPDDPHGMNNLPCILTLPLTEKVKEEIEKGERSPTTVFNYDEGKWFSEGKKLIGKPIDEVIRVFGEDYLISLYRGREEPRMYYRFAGTYSWGIWGVVVLNRDLTVKYFDTDPHSFENKEAVEKYYGIKIDKY